MPALPLAARRLGAALSMALAAILSGTPARADDDAPIPVEAFYGHRDMDEVALSPSGRRLALTSGVGAERVSLAVFDLEGEGQLRIVARFHNADIRSFRWVNDEELVFQIVDYSLGGADQRFGRGLYSVRHDGTELRQLVKARQDFIVERRLERPVLDASHYLMAVPQTSGTSVIVGRVVRDALDDVQFVAPLLLDIRTLQTRSLALGAPEGATNWWFDANGRPWLVASTKDGRTTYHWRATEDGPWKPIASGESLRMPFAAHSVDSSGQLFVTRNRGAEGYGVLHRFDFATGRPDPTPLVSTPGFDFAGDLVSADSDGRTLGVRTLIDGETTAWFDPKMKQIQQTADAKLPGRINRVRCRRCGSDDPVILVKSWSDQMPGEYWVYRPKGERWQRIGAERSAIDPRRMAQLDLHRITARDGLELPVWVTRPSGTTAARRPAVLLVHGGPWLRGRQWNWSADAQFLASRGYVVIEPEFRGSAGYGRRHFEAGWKQWGTAMQDDLIDALQWVIDKGWVDRDRVCIAGASYGGYATLMGLARDGERFRCGVAWAGVTDPRLMFGLPWINDISQEARQFTLPTLIGDPKADAAQLAAVAPVELASRIKAPVLLAYGGKDARVPIEHGERMRDALRKAGNDPEWVVYPDEPHGFFKPTNRYDFARRLEAFLARHLK